MVVPRCTGTVFGEKLIMLKFEHSIVQCCDIAQYLTGNPNLSLATLHVKSNIERVSL